MSHAREEPPVAPLSLRDLSSATCAFGECRLPSQQYARALVVSFQGEAGNSHQHVGTFAFMEAMVAAGVAAWSPEALVLDLTHLKYGWGDEMGCLLANAPLPTTVVTSAMNRDGLASLIRAELFADPGDWLFDSLAGAVAGCDRKYRAELEPREPQRGVRPEELLDKVRDREAFIAFVRALADERENAEEIERADPDRYPLDGAHGWKNADIPSFLYAALDYFEEGVFHKPEAQPSWRMFAEFLYFGKIIE